MSAIRDLGIDLVSLLDINGFKKSLDKMRNGISWSFFPFLLCGKNWGGFKPRKVLRRVKADGDDHVFEKLKECVAYLQRPHY